mgnify:CR=1 FL=1
MMHMAQPKEASRHLPLLVSLLQDRAAQKNWFSRVVDGGGREQRVHRTGQGRATIVAPKWSDSRNTVRTIRNKIIDIIHNTCSIYIADFLRNDSFWGRREAQILLVQFSLQYKFISYILVQFDGVTYTRSRGHLCLR